MMICSAAMAFPYAVYSHTLQQPASHERYGCSTAGSESDTVCLRGGLRGRLTGPSRARPSLCRKQDADGACTLTLSHVAPAQAGPVLLSGARVGHLRLNALRPPSRCCEGDIIAKCTRATSCAYD